VRGIPKGNEFVIEKQKQQRNDEGLLCITQAILCSYPKEGVTMACRKTGKNLKINER
jgi:hypothetical protein